MISLGSVLRTTNKRGNDGLEKAGMIKLQVVINQILTERALFPGLGHLG